MMKAIAIRVCVVFVALFAAIATFGTGTSAAKDPYVGQTYAYASGKVSEKGGQPIISTVVGDQLSTDDCIVTSWRKASYATTDNFDHSKGYLFALNCTAKLATAASSGNSLASLPAVQKKRSKSKRRG